MDTTTEFTGYTLQEAYNVTALHLAKQKRRCTLRGVVVMRHENRRCPLGKLLPDDLYDAELAHAHANQLPKATIAALLPWTPYNEAVAFLSKIEDVHDEAVLILPSGKEINGYSMAGAMAKELRMIADKFNLDPGAEKKLEGVYWKG